LGVARRNECKEEEEVVAAQERRDLVTVKVKRIYPK
jgi:hypothetical protein